MFGQRNRPNLWRFVRALGMAVGLLAAGALAAVVVSACGTSLLTHPARAGVRATHAADTSEPKTVHTATQPAVTAVVTHTTTTSTGTTTQSQLPGYKHPVIQLGDMNTDEQFILGNLYAIALKHEGYTVVLNSNIGPTEVSQAALKQGSLMVYPEYLNVWDNDVAHTYVHFKSLNDAYEAGATYAQRRGWQLLDPTPFSNTVGVAVSAQYARLNNLYSLSELSRGPGITLGWPPETGDTQAELHKLERAYDFTPAAKQPIDIGSQYAALTNGTLQAAYVNTTDPQLAKTGYVLLRDPKRVFGYGNVVPVTTEKVIDEEGPTFEQTLDRVSRLLTQSAIRGLNYAVTIQHHTPASVAQQFLQGNGVIPPTNYAPVTTTTTATTSTTGHR